MNVLRILRYIHQREIIFPNGSINIPVSQFISPEHSCHISFTIPNQYKLLRQLILKEPQFFYFFLYGVYVQDDIKMYNYEAINSTMGSFNFFNKRELVQEMHEVPKGIEYDVRHRNRHVTVLNQSDNALYDITTVRYKNTGSVSNILINNLC